MKYNELLPVHLCYDFKKLGFNDSCYFKWDGNKIVSIVGLDNCTITIENNKLAEHECAIPTIEMAIGYLAFIEISIEWTVGNYGVYFIFIRDSKSVKKMYRTKDKFKGLATAIEYVIVTYHNDTRFTDRFNENVE